MLERSELAKARYILASRCGFERTIEEIENTPRAIEALEAWKYSLMEHTDMLERVLMESQAGVPIKTALEREIGHPLDDTAFQTWVDMLYIFGGSELGSGEENSL